MKLEKKKALKKREKQRSKRLFHKPVPNPSTVENPSEGEKITILRPVR